MDDQLLTRISNVANYYRGARWGLSFDSADGGEWSMSMIAQSQDPEGESGDPIDHLMQHLTKTRANPVFAMRCSSLAVIAEALESWHAHSLAKEL